MSEEAVKMGLGTVHLDVDLDTSKDPAVIISDRDKGAISGDKIKWKKGPDAASFEFSDFGPQGGEFGNVDVAHNKIECDFVTGKPADTAHPYTILVKDDDGCIYSSDKKDGVVNPDSGKAVIRN